MSEDTSLQDEKESEPDDSGENHHFGLKLKNQRELLKMTQAEAATKLNLDISYIEAIETEDFSNISSTSYVFGYIRSYSKLLKLPEQEILDMYKGGETDEHQLLPDYMDQKTIYTNATENNRMWSLMFVVVIALIIATWWFIRQ